MAGSKKTNHGKKSGSSLRDGEVKIDFNRSTDQPTGTEREVFEKMWTLYLETQGSTANNEENFEHFKNYMQRVSTEYSFPEPNGNVANIINQKELVPMWIKIYSGSKNYTLESENDITGDEIKTMIRAIGNSSDLEDVISTILFRIRCYTRSNTQYETTDGSKYPSFQWRNRLSQTISPFTLFRALEAKVHDLDLETELKSQIKFATSYEKAVLLNSKRAFSRSLSELSKIQDQSFRNPRICHPALTFPKEMVEILMIYTQSMIGAHYKSEDFKFKFEQLREWSNKLFTEVTDDLEANSLAIIQYYLQVSLERMDGQNYDYGFWLEFKSNHPDFYPDRVGSYLMQFKQKQVPWQSKMQESFRILTESISVKRDADLKDLTKNGLDLSVNNPTSVLRNEHLNFRKKAVSRDTKDIHYSSSYEINKWISYIDLIKLNLFRATKNLSQHLIRYGPYDLQSGALTWIKSEFSGVTSGESDPQYLFKQYMRQNFKTSRNLKTTKLDRTNLISMVLGEMSEFLKSYGPPSARFTEPVMYRVGLHRRPVLIAEGKDEIPLALHINCAFQRISDLCSGVTIVRNALEISSLIETHRIAIERILSSFEEFLGIELLHIQLISRSREVSESLQNSNEYISGVHQELMGHFNSLKNEIRETNQSRTLKRAEFNQLLFSLPGNPIQRGHRSKGVTWGGLDDQTHEFKPIFFKHPEEVTKLVSVDAEASDPKELFKTLCPESLIHRFSIDSIDEGKIAELMVALATREAYHPDPIPIVHSLTGYMSTFKDYIE